jgi:mannose-6-phosphate isomerase-like protein (cupin superfamily)
MRTEVSMDIPVIKVPERHPKGWGEEQWIVNNPSYCGKKMVLQKDKRCSIHYHNEKDETFYVHSGKVQMDFYPDGYPGEPVRFLMNPGDSVRIPPRMLHRFTGIEDSEMFEFSTEHREEDTYRVSPGDSQQ